MHVYLDSPENPLDDLPVFYNDFVELWKDSKQKVNDASIDAKYLEMSKMLGQFAEINRQFISIFNIKSQKVLFLSNNYLEVLGYTCTEEDYKKYSVVYWMRDMPLNQSWFFMQMSLFFKSTVQPLLKKAGDIKSLKWYMHNFKLTPPKSGLHNISLTCSGLEFLSNGSMIVMMLIIKDVKGLVKEKTPWWAEFDINDGTKYYYHEKDKKFAKGSILSDREKEILNHIKNGLDTKEIAEKLFLSPHTVEKHRKNMLEFTGARDISSLIQICGMGNII
ncbi:MAG: response regulator transcription factor [Leadbetterella sp.]